LDVTQPSLGPHTDDGESIFAVVARLARRATDGQLVIASVMGISAAAIIGLVWPALWLVALPFLCIGSFGIWGIADRTTSERLTRLGPEFGGRRALAGVRVAAAVVGTLSGTLALLTVVARAIGTWKS
jgi:hypothetical protein